MNPALKAFCKKNGYSCRFRKQGTRYYVTIAAKPGIEGWLRDYTTIIRQHYPTATMTSGSIQSATFFIGDVVEILKS